MSIARILPLQQDRLPLYGSAASRAIEAAALAGRPVDELMERAGLAIARLALALQPREGPIWVACGPGHNGGDGRIATRRLQAHGRQVHIGLGPPPEAPALAIDALLGLGLNRPPDEAMAAAIAALNACEAPVLAVDLPSGLLVDTGRPAGVEAVRAAHTLSLLTLKPGLFLGREHCGRIWFDDLGITAGREPDAWLLGADCASAWRAPSSHAAHKGTQGDVLVVGGAPGMRGAARLAARAALAAGAGRVYLHLLDAGADEPDPQRPELLTANTGTPAGRTVVAGCGGASAITQDLTPLLQEAARLVLDADALNALAADTTLRQALRQRGAPTILTPHPLEAARLLGSSTAAVQGDRLAAAQALADELRCT
ncbi:NAD(P)H-hydrate epimerase, partial [Pelomonas sp. KK5]|uniref:NAD(P)H-hydrate epimerase n=1 Tax=Pelomonas sp. KK5 TaxID=1855730 RepID=UPI00097C1111